MEPLLGGHGSEKRRGAGQIAVFFTLVSCVLFIVAAATPSLIHTEGLGGVDSEDSIYADFGPYRVCSHIEGITDYKCTDYDSNCEFQVQTPLGSLPYKVVDDCSAWNAARGALIAAIVITFLAFLVQLIVACTASASGALRAAAVVLGMVGAFCGLLAMALFASRKDNDDKFTRSHSASFMYGFYLIIVGWVLALLASLPFCSK